MHETDITDILERICFIVKPLLPPNVKSGVYYNNNYKCGYEILLRAPSKRGHGIRFKHIPTDEKIRFFVNLLLDTLFEEERGKLLCIKKNLSLK